MVPDLAESSFTDSIAGPIPADWSASLIKDFARVVRGSSPRPAGSPLYFDGDYLPWITVGDVTKDDRMWLSSTKSCLTTAGAERTRTIVPGTLLLTNSGATLGVPKISSIRAGANDGIAMIIELDGVESQYLYYFLCQKTRYFREMLAPGVGQPNLNTTIIGHLPVPLPPLAEQSRIVEILSTWDDAIETIENLIANSVLQKDALMQKLLRPEARRGGDDSHKYRLCDVADILISNVDKKSHAGEQPVKLCNYTDVYYNDYITSDLHFMEATATKAQIDKFSLRKGDILITKDSETPDDIAVPSLVDEDLEGVVCGYHLAIIRPKEDVDGAYLRSLFSLGATQHYFFTRANGATRFGLTIDAIKDAVFTLPSLEQQEEAAKIIRNAEKVVHAYQEVLERLHREKQALMQQLLTGKRRVRVDEAVESAYA